jgi:lysophospholipase L1-like esterase
VLGGLLAAALLTAGAGYFRSLPPPPHKPIAAAGASSPAIAFIGDSLSIGAYLPPGSPAYPELAGAALHGRVHNLGVAGITTWEAMRRELRLVPPETTIAVIYLGTNDLMQGPIEHSARLGSGALMHAAFLTMVTALKHNGVATYVVLLRDLGKMPRFASDRALAQRIGAWTESWDRWAATRGAIPIDLRCFSDVDDVRNYQSDQVHPTARGTQLLAEHVAYGVAHRGVTCR